MCLRFVILKILELDRRKNDRSSAVQTNIQGPSNSAVAGRAHHGDTADDKNFKRTVVIWKVVRKNILWLVAKAGFSTYAAHGMPWEVRAIQFQIRKWGFVRCVCRLVARAPCCNFGRHKEPLRAWNQTPSKIYKWEVKSWALLRWSLSSVPMRC